MRSVIPVRSVQSQPVEAADDPSGQVLRRLLPGGRQFWGQRSPGSPARKPLRVLFRSSEQLLPHWNF